MTMISGGGSSQLARELNGFFEGIGGKGIPGLERLDPRTLQRLAGALRPAVDQFQRNSGSGVFNGLASSSQANAMRELAQLSSMSQGSGRCGAGGGVNPLRGNCCGGGLQSPLRASSNDVTADMLEGLGGGGCFEDRIFALMCKVVKDMQEQIEQRLKKLEAQAKAAEAKGGQGGEGGGGGAEGQESRNIEFEKIKFDMQKLSQMQQAMSNVLNTMDELAKSAIRHIKAG